MSKKHIHFLLSLFSLLLGGVIYFLYRENTYISNFVEQIINLENLRLKVPFKDSLFVNGYFCDYLWAFSFLNAFYSLFFDVKKTLFLPMFVFVCGLIWEVLQLLNFVSGTFDFFDVFMYLAAVLTGVLINILLNLRRKQNEKV